MIENQEKLVREIVERVEKTPYIMCCIPMDERVEFLCDLQLVVLAAVLNHDNQVMEEETLS